jgi:hypothetical protein
VSTYVVSSGRQEFEVLDPVVDLVAVAVVDDPTLGDWPDFVGVDHSMENCAPAGAVITPGLLVVELLASIFDGVHVRTIVPGVRSATLTQPSSVATR